MMNNKKMNDQSSKSNFERWVQKMWATQDEEISCSECLDLVPAYVDLELATGEAEHRMPRLKHHLDQCRACQDDYRIVLDLARKEADGNPPSIEDLKGALR
jgi:hypothetical protein